MNQNFIVKLETEKYLIGSFDAYLDMSKTLIKNNPDFSKEIELDNGYKLVSPKILVEKNIDLNKVLASHIKAIQNREKFTIPLG